MNKSLKTKWVRALRSGKYRQGEGFLKQDGAYCCLGVLRDIMHPKSRATNKDEELLCDRHEKEAGLTFEIQEDLAKKNDGGWSFERLANHIEKRL